MKILILDSHLDYDILNNTDITLTVGVVLVKNDDAGKFDIVKNAYGRTYHSVPLEYIGLLIKHSSLIFIEPCFWLSASSTIENKPQREEMRDRNLTPEL